MLFLRLDRDSECSARLFARSGRLGEDGVIVESVVGSEGGCVIAGILDASRVGLCTNSWDDSVRFSEACGIDVLSSAVVVLISGDEWVK